MSKNYSVERRDIDGVDVTLVTEQDSEVLRTNVIVPFNPASIQAGVVGYEVPHVLEHVVFCGDGSGTAADFKEQADRLGGYSNASTSMTINGKLSFETTQPNEGMTQVKKMVQAVFSPGYTAQDITEHKTIVRNELNGYLQDPVRQRMNKMFYNLGERYTTDPLGIEGLQDITREELALFHSNVFTKNNARIAIAGRPELVEKLAPALAKICIDNADMGERELAANSDMLHLPDYHSSASEIPDGMTNFFHCRVSEGNMNEDLSFSEFSVIAGAFYEYLTEGRFGITEQSRSRGLSYGTRVGWQYNKRQMCVSINDTISTEHVAQQISLLTEGLGRAADYDSRHFEQFRQKQLGRTKLYPGDLVNFAKGVESLVATEELLEVNTPQQYQHTLHQLDAHLAASRVCEIAEHLRMASFVRQHSFGDNPFSPSTVSR